MDNVQPSDLKELFRCVRCGAKKIEQEDKEIKLVHAYCDECINERPLLDVFYREIDHSRDFGNIRYRTRMIKDALVEGRIETRYLEPHESDCKALRHVDTGDWDTPWTFAKSKFMDKEADEYISTKSETRQGHNFIVLRCNNPNCPAKLGVDSEDLIKVIDPDFDPKESKTNSGKGENQK